jgi:hypothetical protein
MEIKLQPGAVRGDTARVWLDYGWLQTIELQNVVPEPDSVEAGSDRLIYVFKMNRPDQPTTITFDYSPVRIGARDVSIGLDGGETITFNQVTYP